MKFSSPLPAHPPLLTTYLATASPPRWQNFRDEQRDAYDELVSKLYVRQRGLCAFCEIDLLTSVATNAREIEHWRPKSLDNPPSVIWTFGIDNLQLGCLGGSNRFPVADLARTANPPPGPNLSCGSKKGDNDPNNTINGVLPYRPSDFLESPPMFSVDDDGALRPIPNCTTFGIDPARLWSTIDFLGLNCQRLKNARRAIRENLDKTLMEYIDVAPEIDDDARMDAALLQLAEDTAPPYTGTLPPFITTIRSYFGPEFNNTLFPRRGWSEGI